MIKFICKHAENLFVFTFLVLVLVVAVLLYQNTKLTFINQHLESELVETQNDLNGHEFEDEALNNGQWEEEK